MPAELEPEDVSIFEDRLWHHKGWEARVIKNEDDDGWAVAMTQDGQAEPSLVGPWTMGRDKKNPKPLDVSAFNTLVKTAHEVMRRHEQHLAAQFIELQAFAMAIEESGVELPLQFVEAHADGGLGQRKALRRLGNAFLAGHGNKGFQLA